MDVAAVEEVATTPMMDRVRKQEVEITTGRPGVRMFLAVPAQSMLNNPIEGEPQNIQIFHKKFEGLVTPFDRPIKCFPEYVAMLEAIRRRWHRST